MFTSCPACQRQYRISANQLAAAQGLARCGYCGEEFSALQRLTEKPVKLAVKKPPGAVRPKPPPAEHAHETVPPDDGYEPQFDIPEILESDEEKTPTSNTARVLWSSILVLLLIAISAQLAWFNRDYLLERYPQIQPLAESMCDRLDCRLSRVSSIDGIELLNRDVRLHPNFRDTLLVNATMANASGRIMPFPKIQFALFDTEGRMIAQRQFMPPEYLDNSIDVEKGMPVNQPVHFVLEVTGPTRTAVSFEFRFL